MYNQIIEQLSVPQQVTLLKQVYMYNRAYTEELLFHIAKNSNFNELLTSEDEECWTLGWLMLLGDFYFDLREKYAFYFDYDLRKMLRKHENM